jgi:hypothetical protein
VELIDREIHTTKHDHKVYEDEKHAISNSINAIITRWIYISWIQGFKDNLGLQDDDLHNHSNYSKRERETATSMLTHVKLTYRRSSSPATITNTHGETRKRQRHDKQQINGEIPGRTQNGEEAWARGVARVWASWGWVKGGACGWV